MISGAVRGQGAGDALARHLLKTGNDTVTVIAARGLGATGLVDQLRELVALSLGGRTDRPVYHVHINPDPGIRDEAAARARWWALFEAEFGLQEQPYCGALHVKGGRGHEHRVYGLVRANGKVVDLAWDFPRREKCSRVVEYEAGLSPVASKHARSIVQRLRADGRADVAAWLVAHGSTKAARPVAATSPQERLIEERTGVHLEDVRRLALAAWRASADGADFRAALQARGLDLRQGRKGAVIVDGAGTAHLATRVIGAAARRLEGNRILAAEVRARLHGIGLEGIGNGHGTRATPRRAGAPAARDRVGAGIGGPGGIVGVRRPDRGLGRPDGGSGGHDAGGAVPAIGRLRALPPVRALTLRRRLSGLDPTVASCLAATERARAAVDRIEEWNAYEKERAWRLWGMTDIWGVPLR